MGKFEIKSQAGDARIGHLHFNDTDLETPHLFPVISFYGGGNQEALFGGGFHRTVKEFMVNHERQVNDGKDFSNLFDGLMTSISSLTDFNISEDKLEEYLSKEIREWEAFQDFEGVIFLDSGGFKVMTQGALEGSNFEKEIDQETAYELQRRVGGDILVNLDRPILPDDTYEDRVKKADKTLENAKEFIEISEGFNGARYLTVHGYDKSMMERFFNQAEEKFDGPLDKIFDGIALGSLVPKKDDYGTLIDAVGGCKEVMQERGLENMPLHVLGISSSAIPLLVLLGADTFDSGTYFQTAINGKYMTSLTDHKTLEEAREQNFSECNCRVCSDPDLVKKMQGEAEYQKDIYGPVAIHNMEVQKREIEALKDSIREGEDALRLHIEKTLGEKDGLKRFAYRAVNRSLEEYF
ncbi:MAG: tRNA-guanine transglycosylase [Candidatus Nanohalobium sp.]